LALADSGSLGGLRKEAVNRTAGFRVPLDAAKALAGTLQAFAYAEGDSQSRTGQVAAQTDGREHALHLRGLAAHADDLGQLADQFGGAAARSEPRVGEQPSEKLVACVGDGTQNGRASPRVGGIAPGDGGEGVGGARVSYFAEGEGQLETDASVGIGAELEEGVTQRTEGVES
jgi:hypothetical protein